MTLAVAKIAALIAAYALEQHMSLAAPRSLILDVQISPAASKIIVLIDVFAPDKNLNLAAKSQKNLFAQINLAADRTPVLTDVFSFQMLKQTMLPIKLMRR